MSTRDWVFLWLCGGAIAYATAAYSDEKTEQELFFKNSQAALALHAKFLSAKHEAASERYRIGAVLSACDEGALAKAMFASAIKKENGASDKLKKQLEVSPEKPTIREIATADASSAGSMGSYTLGANEVASMIAASDQGRGFCSRVTQKANKILATE